MSITEHIAIAGAGSGGKAAATALILQSKKVNLFEFPEYKENLTDLLESKTLIASGAVEGEATLEVVNSEIHEVMDGVDTVIICTQALAHDRAAVNYPHSKKSGG